MICYFGSALGEMKKKDQGDHIKVLHVLKDNPMFSVFDATENEKISRTMNYLTSDGYIQRYKTQPSYPWIKVFLTIKGLKTIND